MFVGMVGHLASEIESQRHLKSHNIERSLHLQTQIYNRDSFEVSTQEVKY